MKPVERFCEGPEVAAKLHHRESLGILHAPRGARADFLREKNDFINAADMLRIGQ